MGNNIFHTDILVVGAGAAGLMAAIGAACQSIQDGKKVKITILEKMEKAGRKIAITGKGRCNFTNMKNWNDFSPHVHPKPNLLKSAFYNMPPDKLLGFFESEGMPAVVERGDRAFPASHKSWDVVDTLVSKAVRCGVEIHYNTEVSDISHNENDDYSFRVASGNGKLYCSRKLIIASGGLSYPSTGSTGDGYRWARDLRHKPSICHPSLTALVPKGYKTVSPSEDGHIPRESPLSEFGSKLCGNQLKNIGLSVIIDGNVIAEEFGDIDFTDGGLEGPLGFLVSRRCVKAVLNGSKVKLSVDFKPAVPESELQNRIYALWKAISEDRRSSGRPYNEKFNILLGKLLPREFIAGFIAGNNIGDHNRLARRLKNWELDISGYVGYERCVITAGGIPAEELKPKTLESKICGGLYFAGEVLDLDADTGGYNLQIAFCTGYLAGQSAAKAL